jgi:hypothetical protein
MDGFDYYDDLLKLQKVVKDRIRGVDARQHNGLYLHGRPSTAKTHLVLTTLDTRGANYVYHSGHLTPIGLFLLLSENRDRVIVLDDVAALFNEPIALQLLLAALGNPHDGSKARRVRYKTAREDVAVPFTGGVIMISNLPLAGHHSDVLRALRDRIHVILYEPSDEHIIALINKIASDGIGGVSPEKCQMVAVFLLQECKLREIRPSVRLFVDKAIKDYALWETGKTETHWRDLVVSTLEHQLIELRHPQRDLTRTEQAEAERRVALDITLSFETRKERIREFERRTGMSQATYYRRVKELVLDGRLRISASRVHTALRGASIEQGE